MANYNMDYSTGGYHYPQERSKSAQRIADPYQHHHTLSQAIPPMHNSNFAPPLPRYLHSEYTYSRTSSSDVQAPQYEDDSDKRIANSEETLPPEMEALITDIMTKFKSKGTFDRFRRECLSDIDTKPAFINLTTRVKNLVDNYLKKITWTPAISKVKIRESMRKYMTDARFFDRGVDRVVDQVVNPKVNSVFFPLVEEEVYNFLGIEKPKDFYDEDDNDIEEDEVDVVNVEEYSVEDMDISVEEKSEASAEPEQFKKEIINQSDLGKSVPREKIKLGQWIPIPDATESSSLISLSESDSKAGDYRTESDLKSRPESPFEEEEPLPPGEEREVNMPNNEMSKFEVSSPHTPEDEYNEHLIKEREELYYSNSCQNDGSNTPPPPCSSTDTKEKVSEKEPDDLIIEGSENEPEECVTSEEETDDEEEESPPFEKIGDSPPPSPKKEISIDKCNTEDRTETKTSSENVIESETMQKLNISAPRVEENSIGSIGEITEDVIQKDEEENKSNNEVVAEVTEQTVDLTDKESKVQIPEDVEDTPVFFLEPIPSLVEKSEFYQQFRDSSLGSSDNEGPP